MIKILVATDLSERSAHAIQRAVQLVKAQGGGEWGLVHIVDDDAPAIYVDRQVQQAETLLLAQAEQLAGEAGSRPKILVNRGEIAPLIVESAEGFGAELLVVGTHRKSTLRDLFLGTTLERLIRSSHVPVLRVNGPATKAYGPALLALDQSATSLAAMNQASRLGLLDEHNFTAVNVVELISSGSVMDAGISADLFEAQKVNAREAALEALRDAGVDLPEERLWVQSGFPEQVVGTALRETGAELLVLGTHARKGIARFVLGSMAGRLLAELECDALTVPPLS